MDVLLGASIIASFIAGMIALFAPCCITVLLPAYLASAFREKKNILKMTFIFFAGISVVLVPIGLGAAGLAQLFRDFHSQMYIIGGLFMALLGVFSLMGKKMELIPFAKHIKTDMREAHGKSVFGLGVLSGAATSCCAPVLAGAMTLAVASGAFWKALIVTFAYVFGMTFPLFLSAYFYDKYQIEKSSLIQGKTVRVRLGRRGIDVHSTNLLAGIIFLGMGALMVGLGWSGSAFWSPEYQAKIGEALNRWSTAIIEALSVIPDLVWGALIIGTFSFFALRSKKSS